MTSKKEWLSQFEANDQPTAEKLLAAVHTVSHDEFARVLERLIRRQYELHSEPTAVFVEREVKKSRSGGPCKMFKEEKVPVVGRRKQAVRACGASPAVLYFSRGDKTDVGSEGLMASITGQLARNRDLHFVTNPSPNLFRRAKIRHFFVVTDLIGSGDRVWNFLESAWRVRTVRSWHSKGLIRFTVLAYASTEAGEARVRSHPCGPEVVKGRECPTIRTEFGFNTNIPNLCKKYYRGTKEPLGYKDTGALIIFRHGCPNNVPRILFEADKGWLPLFPGRIGSIGFDDLRPKFTGVQYGDILDSLGLSDLGRKQFFLKFPDSGKKMILVMCAIRKGMVKPESLCAGTKLPLHEIDDLLKIGIHQGLLTRTCRLTDLGVGTLGSVITKNLAENLPKVEKSYYYPKQLRLPSKSI
ncbi:hypothetical protein GJ700_29430 [Duganella sp. FT92W]|uniref:Uncharacterized protein n=1 Tax=Pseudoduganella rivuli TaxID=2666085 RepID=A0A7X2LVU1_9BURK|nr:hypothetical protein [Pseudoduganella rivuli]MRV75841.1 hypothetical protein [Pseudoduganella rivuli]